MHACFQGQYATMVCDRSLKGMVHPKVAVFCEDIVCSNTGEIYWLIVKGSQLKKSAIP